MVVYDGYRRVAGASSVDITLTGFTTPPFGTVTSKLGVVGFCFGGLCAFDLARANALHQHRADEFRAGQCGQRRIEAQQADLIDIQATQAFDLGPRQQQARRRRAPGEEFPW